MEALARDEMIFALGPGGHRQDLSRRRPGGAAADRRPVDRLILSRPAVEAGERLGFLPGDMKEKVDPYLRPLYDALYDMLPTEQVERRIASGEIEIAPIAFMRGRTLVRRLHHPRRGAEHHAAADEDVPHPLRHAQPDGGLRRSASRSTCRERGKSGLHDAVEQARGDRQDRDDPLRRRRRRPPSARRADRRGL